MWHKFKKDLLSYYSKQKVNGVMGMNGIMRTYHNSFLNLGDKKSYFQISMYLYIQVFPCLEKKNKILNRQF